MKILLLDNYDSFTFNLLHILEQIDGLTIEVIRNDEMNSETTNYFDAIILSPGPGIPDEAGQMKDMITLHAPRKKILGICLGHQAIAEVFGARLKNLNTVRHGVALETIVLDPTDALFRGIPTTFYSGRYHSWVIDPQTIPPELRITAIDREDNIMAIKHVGLPIWGMQFHPESILTQFGKELIINFLNC